MNQSNVTQNQSPTKKCLPLPSTMRLLQQRPSLALLVEALRDDLTYMPTAISTQALDNSLLNLLHLSVPTPSATMSSTSPSTLSLVTYQPPSLTESKQLSTQWQSRDPREVFSAKALLSLSEHPGIRLKSSPPSAPPSSPIQGPVRSAQSQPLRYPPGGPSAPFEQYYAPAVARPQNHDRAQMDV